MANLITCFRMAASAALLFCPVYSPGFWALYLLAGLSDMIDGAVARRTQTVSERGARLDTLADLILAAVCLYKLLPVLELPRWIWIWTAVIALIKLVNVVSGFVADKKFPAVHTPLNRAAGLLLFAFPLIGLWIGARTAAPFVCAAATLAAVQEGHLIPSGRAGAEKKS